MLKTVIIRRGRVRKVSGTLREEWKLVVFEKKVHIELSEKLNQGSNKREEFRNVVFLQ
jgi:hypothetical protein